MARIFIVDGKEYPDPGAELTVEQVRQQMAQFFPELSNAETSEAKRDADVLYTFKRRVGTKGRVKPGVITASRLVAALKKVPAKNFSIQELAPQLLDEQGKVDTMKAVDRMPEVNLALVEIKTYVKAVKDMRLCLSQVKAS